MNQTQRKFLIERIQKTVRESIKVLEGTKMKYPSASNYIFRAILNNNLKLQPKEVISKALKDKALKAKEGKNWLESSSNSWMDYKENNVSLPIRDLIVVPDDYDKEYNKVKTYNEGINKKIELLRIQLDSIEVRVQLASDSKLKKLINDVDDMGDVRLVDANLKLIE